MRRLLILAVLGVTLSTSLAEAQVPQINSLTVPGSVSETVLVPPLSRQSTILERLLQETSWNDLNDKSTDMDRAVAEYVRELLREDVESRTVRKSVLRWHRISSRINFLLAHLFVLLGLVAAGYEFKQAWTLRQHGKNASEITLKLSVEGIAVRTSLLGVLLLGLSLAFYYMFLAFVYPLQVI